MFSRIRYEFRIIPLSHNSQVEVVDVIANGAESTYYARFEDDSKDRFIDFLVKNEVKAVFASGFFNHIVNEKVAHSLFVSVSESTFEEYGFRRMG